MLKCFEDQIKIQRYAILLKKRLPLNPVTHVKGIFKYIVSVVKQNNVFYDIIVCII